MGPLDDLDAKRCTKYNTWRERRAYKQLSINYGPKIYAYPSSFADCFPVTTRSSKKLHHFEGKGTEEASLLCRKLQSPTFAPSLASSTVQILPE